MTMMKCAVIVVCVSCLILAGQALAQEESTVAGAIKSITVDDLHNHIETLASDSFEGREAGRRGGRAAGAYIRQALKQDGLPPAGQGGTYYQSKPTAHRGKIFFGTPSGFLHASMGGELRKHPQDHPFRFLSSAASKKRRRKSRQVMISRPAC